MTTPAPQPPSDSSLGFDVALALMMLVAGVLVLRFVAAGVAGRMLLLVWVAGWIAFPIFRWALRYSRRAKESASSRDGPGRRSSRLLWDRATERHDRVLGDYLPFETDPDTVLRYPAISDVTEEPTQRFLDALGQAQALRTDEYPGGDLAEDYVAASEALEVAWARAKRHAMKVGRDHLADTDAQLLGQAAKLLAQAGSTTLDHERAAYAARANRLLDDLVARGVIVLPPRVTDAIERQSRREIEPPGDT